MLDFHVLLSRGKLSVLPDCLKEWLIDCLKEWLIDQKVDGLKMHEIAIGLF